MTPPTPRKDGRYFVVLQEAATNEPYVVAETAREESDGDDDRELSLAGNVAGASSRIMTESEIRALPGGSSALARWRRRDDRRFETENRELSSLDDAAGPPPFAPHLVPSAHPDTVRTTRRRAALALVR